MLRIAYGAITLSVIQEKLKSNFQNRDQTRDDTKEYNTRHNIHRLVETIKLCGKRHPTFKPKSISARRSCTAVYLRTAVALGGRARRSPFLF